MASHASQNKLLMASTYIKISETQQTNDTPEEFNDFVKVFSKEESQRPTASSSLCLHYRHPYVIPLSAFTAEHNSTTTTTTTT